MEKVKILEPFEYIRNETPEEKRKKKDGPIKLTEPACISAAGLEPC